MDIFDGMDVFDTIEHDPPNPPETPKRRATDNQPGYPKIVMLSRDGMKIIDNGEFKPYPMMEVWDGSIYANDNRRLGTRWRYR